MGKREKENRRERESGEREVVGCVFKTWFIHMYFIIFSLLRCDSSSMADYGLDGLSSTMSELHYGSRASSPGGSVLRDYRWTQLVQIVLIVLIELVSVE